MLVLGGWELRHISKTWALKGRAFLKALTAGLGCLPHPCITTNGGFGTMSVTVEATRPMFLTDNILSIFLLSTGLIQTSSQCLQGKKHFFKHVPPQPPPLQPLVEASHSKTAWAAKVIASGGLQRASPGSGVPMTWSLGMLWAGCETQPLLKTTLHGLTIK